MDLQKKLPPDYNAKINHHDLWGNGSVTVRAIRASNKTRLVTTLSKPQTLADM